MAILKNHHWRSIMTVTILDGGMGRELHRRGAPFRQPEWSALALMEAPDIVRETHLDFLRAGAQVVTTNSYALVPFHIGQERFDAQAAEWARQAGRLAREAVEQSGTTAKVAASLPPLFGSYRPDLFDKQVAPALARPLISGLMPFADIWLAETVSSLEEARFWRSSLPEDGKPFWVSFTLEDTMPHDVPVLRSGENVHEAADFAVEIGAAAMLFNCSQPEVMAEALKVAHEAQSRLKLGVYANAFEPVQGQMNEANDGLDPIRADATPENYLAWARQWADLGAEIIGGCCGIAPEHIRALAQGFKAV